MKRTSMAQALSQAAGHAFSRPPQPAKPSLDIPHIAQVAAAAATARRPAPPSTVPPSRVGKKPVTAFFDPEVSRQIKKIGLDQDKTMQDLLQEALNDLFRKYDLPPIA
jgi:hypothetical protein